MKLSFLPFHMKTMCLYRIDKGREGGREREREKKWVGPEVLHKCAIMKFYFTVPLQRKLYRKTCGPSKRRYLLLLELMMVGSFVQNVYAYINYRFLVFFPIFE